MHEKKKENDETIKTQQNQPPNQPTKQTKTKQSGHDHCTIPDMGMQYLLQFSQKY